MPCMRNKCNSRKFRTLNFKHLMFQFVRFTSAFQHFSIYSGRNLSYHSPLCRGALHLNRPLNGSEPRFIWCSNQEASWSPATSAGEARIDLKKIPVRIVTQKKAISNILYPNCGPSLLEIWRLSYQGSLKRDEI